MFQKLVASLPGLMAVCWPKSTSPIGDAQHGNYLQHDSMVSLWWKKRCFTWPSCVLRIPAQSLPLEPSQGNTPGSSGKPSKVCQGALAGRALVGLPACSKNSKKEATRYASSCPGVLISTLPCKGSSRSGTWRC